MFQTAETYPTITCERYHCLRGKITYNQSRLRLFLAAIPDLAPVGIALGLGISSPVSIVSTGSLTSYKDPFQEQPHPARRN